LVVWGVHLFTGFGAVAGLMAIIATSNHNWRAAFAWMIVTLAIDSVDGSLARLFQVKVVLPSFDGALLDNIVDYLTYVIVPAYFIYEAGLVPAKLSVLAGAAVTLASGYQFCQVNAKTDDHYFLGFPSYWNVVVFYLFLLPLPKWVNLAILLLLSVGVFVPIKYLYPSRTAYLRPLNILLTLAWSAAVMMALFRFPEGHQPWIYGSLAYVVYYSVFSLAATLRGMTAQSRQSRR